MIYIERSNTMKTTITKLVENPSKEDEKTS